MTGRRQQLLALVEAGALHEAVVEVADEVAVQFRAAAALHASPGPDLELLHAAAVVAEGVVRDRHRFEEAEAAPCGSNVGQRVADGAPRGAQLDTFRAVLPLSVFACRSRRGQSR